MRALTVRHFTEADVPLRTAVLREQRFGSNLTDWALVADVEEVQAHQRRLLARAQETVRIYCACRGDGEVVGFLWITDVDWRAQTCELSVAMLPRYRVGFGTLAVIAAQHHLYGELNIRVVVHRVLEHNTMLNSRDRLATTSQVRCDHDSYTVGEFRTALMWTQTAEDFHANLDRLPNRRDELGARIRARTEKVSS